MVSERKTQSARFRRANERIARLVDDPLIADDVQAFAAERERVNRIHASGLADIRKASKLTQQQMARLLGTDQGTISKIERRDDLLLSTLRQYLAATGAVHPKIVVEKDGVEITLELNMFGA